MLEAALTLSSVLVVALSGYVLGRKHQKKLDVKLRTVYVRPHTKKTIESFPLPEEQEPAVVQDAQWSRTDLPNSGVRWS